MSCLPFDCMKLIVEYLSVEDSISVCLALSSYDDARQLIKDRRSPIRLFSRLVDDPHELLYYMCVHNCCLSGSRAANYMFPGSSGGKSDWNFYVTDVNRGQLFGNMKDAFVTMGVKWFGQVKEPHYGDSYLTTIEGEIVRGNGRGQKIQLNSSPYCLLIETILSFHSTVSQCIITHYGALHLYGKLSSGSKQLVWNRHVESCDNSIDAYNELNCRRHFAVQVFRNAVLDQEVIEGIFTIMRDWYSQYTLTKTQPSTSGLDYEGDFLGYIHIMLHSDGLSPALRAVIHNHMTTLASTMESECICVFNTSESMAMKYYSRGYTLIDFDEYVSTTPNWSRKQNRMSSTHSTILYRTRRATDADVTIIPFKGYKLSCPDKLMEKHIKFLSKVEWREYKDIATMNYVDAEEFA